MRPIAIDDPEALEKAREVLESGGVVVFPTDTLYGILAPLEKTDRVFKIKGRAEDKPSPVFVPSMDKAKELAWFDEKAERLWNRFMPGALTLVLRARIEPIKGVVSERGTIGLRMPNYKPLLKLLEMLNGPTTGTSANPTGMPPAKRFEELSKSILEQVDLVIYDPKPLGGLPSTVVELTEEGFRILREGAIPTREIENALRG